MVCWAFFHSLVFFLSLSAFVCGSELSGCCREGESQYHSRSNCHGVINSRNGLCTRSRRICCHRAMLEAKCQEGERAASLEATCPALAPIEAGGVYKKECCECCLLAKEVGGGGGECVAPDTFSQGCRKTFERCCSTAFSFSYATATIGTELEDNRRRGLSGSCRSNPCDHTCVDLGNYRFECQCHLGYELSLDGRTCTGNDTAHNCSLGFQPGPTNDVCEDVNECETTVPCEEHQLCYNSVGSYDCHCMNGFTWNGKTQVCVDIDECLLLIDSCVQTQRCLNTVGSYRCMRTLNCGTGYILDSETERCIDVDECAHGSHNCGPTYSCRNTQGSFRCEVKRCSDGEVLNSQGHCIRVDCPIGFRPLPNEECQDVDECATFGRCGQFENCVNTPGSYRCDSHHNLCGQGYKMDANTGACVDVDECLENSHTCGQGNGCVNTEGGFKCRCPEGFEFNEQTSNCDDIDECSKFGGQVCSFQARCENSPGSFQCHCNRGYQLAEDERTCEDLDECTTGLANCHQRCINIPGSYQCICNRGYSLSADGLSCEDIDECTLWSGAGTDLCMGGCINTPGSYTCRCPSGYEMQGDGRTCKDVDECGEGVCGGSDRICVNTLGSYKCHTITCPPNYRQDPKFKHRCNRPFTTCTVDDISCRDSPISETYRYIALPRLTEFPAGRTSIPLFTMKGPNVPTTEVQFELTFSDAMPGKANVELATRNSFLLQKGEGLNSAVIALREPLDGPQDIQLLLMMRIHHSGIFGGKAVAKLGVHVAEYRSSKRN